MNTRRTLIASIMLAGGLVSATAHAALQSRLGGQAVYDTDLNVTWLANANLAATDTFGVTGISAGGRMFWPTAQNWIAAMNAADYLGHNDWMLPTTLQPDSSCFDQGGGSWGLDCTGSQMGHLFYSELGGVAGSSITSTHNASYSLFSNIQAWSYWSGTVYAPDPTQAWLFSMGGGMQFWNFQTGSGSEYAWAVLPGDVATTFPTPEADTWAMMAVGLGLIGAVARRKSVKGWG